MNENGNMRLTIGSRYCVNVTVNQGEGGVDHSVVYYSFISLMLAGNGKGGCRREEGAYNRILLTISAISSDPFFLFPLTLFLLHQMLNHRQTPPRNPTRLCQSF